MDFFVFLRLTKDMPDEELLFWRKRAIEHPNDRLIVQLPGTEPNLANATSADLSAAVRQFQDGENPTQREVLLRMEGNPNSGRDRSKVRTLIDKGVPELEVQRAKKGVLTVRLTGPSGDGGGMDETEKAEDIKDAAE
jgi:hypothetical protein